MYGMFLIPYSSVFWAIIKNKELSHSFLSMLIVLIKAWEGVGVVASARKLIGVTNPLEAEPGTIRGDLAIQKGRFDLINFDSWCND